MYPAAGAWNKTRTARILGVDIKTLNKKIRDFQIGGLPGTPPQPG
jgi:DNA-binding protein Fis